MIILLQNQSKREDLPAFGTKKKRLEYGNKLTDFYHA